MPSSVVEARYNLNSLQLKKLQFEYANYNDLMKAKCDRRTMRREKETAFVLIIIFFVMVKV